MNTLARGFLKATPVYHQKSGPPVAYAVRAAECPSRLRPSIGGPADVGAGRSRLARRLLASFLWVTEAERQAKIISRK